MPARSRSAAARSRAFFEAHIEQGPILEAEEKTIGVVTGAQGQRWYEVTVTGQEAHAGPTPMRAAQGRAGRRRADGRGGQPHRPRAPPLRLRHRRHDAGQPELAQHHPGQGLLHRRLPPPATTHAGRRWTRASAPRRAEGRRARSGSSSTVEADLVLAAGAVRPTAASTRCAARPRSSATPHRDIVSGAGHDAGYMAPRGADRR